MLQSLFEAHWNADKTNIMKRIFMNKFNFLLIAAMVLAFGAGVASAQKKAADYKITNIKIMPFDGATGLFEEELTAGSDRSFFNDLSISLLVLFEVSGESGSFEAGRMLSVTVTEGKRVKARKNEQVGLIGSGGKFYIPVWLDSAMCDTVKITARLTGQKTASTMTRSVPFVCGE